MKKTEQNWRKEQLDIFEKVIFKEGYASAEKKIMDRWGYQLAEHYQRGREEMLADVGKIWSNWLNKMSDNKEHWFECGLTAWEEFEQELAKLGDKT